MVLLQDRLDEMTDSLLENLVHLGEKLRKLEIVHKLQDVVFLFVTDHQGKEELF